MTLEARDLDPERHVYKSATGTCLHLSRRCLKLRNGGEAWESRAGVEFADEPVCSRCEELNEGAGDLGAL